MRRQKTDALGNVIRLDEPTSSGLGTIDSPNQASNYTYDVLGNLVHVNQSSQDRYFKFDSLSRLIRERQAEQATNSSYNLGDTWNTSGAWSRKVVYNSSGLVTEGDDARGVQTSLAYDDLNRPTTITYSDSTPAAHYYYDAQTLPTGAPSYTHGYSTGRLLAMTYGSGATGDYFGYDNMGQIVTQKQASGSTTYGLSYTYNYAGMLTGETYPSGRAMNYAYGVNAKLSSVSDGTTTFANSFSYAPNGGLASETLGNTAVHAISYNHAQQASQVKLTLGANVLQQFDYSYGDYNSTSGVVDTTKNNGQIGKTLSTIGTTPQWTQGFSYDTVSRLANVAEHQGNMGTSTYSQAYTYDLYGNRFQSANGTLGLPAIASTEINAATNRFIATGSTPTTYDEAGNIKTDTKFRGLKYNYDANGRQTSVTLIDNSSVQTSVYDSAGQRVQTTAGGVTRTMVYDIFGQDVADYSGSSLERENIYGGGLLATYEVSGTALKYALQDVQGSTRAMMNNSGGSSAIIARHDYLPFGEEISSGIGLRTTGQGFGASDTSRQKYSLLERDDSTGLDHSWFRKYENLSGRWTSPDPYAGSARIGDPQSFNRYSYTQNDPVNFVDPSGLDVGNPPPPPPPMGPPPSIVTVYGSFLSPASSGGVLGGGGPGMHAPLMASDAEIIEKAFLDAGTVLLQDKDCAKFFGARTKTQRERLVTSTLDSVRQNAQQKNTKAYLAKTVGAGRSAIITLGTDFFGDAAFRESKVGPTDPQQGRAETILHELAHAMGLIPNDGPGYPDDQGYKNDKTIMSHCAKGLGNIGK